MVRRGGWDVVIDKRIKRSALVFVTLLIAGGCENESTPSPDGGGGIQGDSGAHPNGDAGMPMGDAGTDGGSGTDEAEITMGRLIVADSASPSVRVIDLDDASVFDSMSLASTARVYGNSSGRYAYAVQADGDRVTIFDSGILFTSHEDHYHITKSAPSVLTTHLDGDRPIHFVIHGEEDMPNSWYAATFNDGSGILQIVQERSLSTATPFVIEVNSGAPHHGVGLVARGHVILSNPAPEGSLPNGVTLRELATPDEVEETIALCPGLHGEASNHHGVAFACADGILRLEAHEDHFHSMKLDYPEGNSGDVRSGTLRTAHDIEFFVGDWEGGLVLIHPESEPHFMPIAIASPVLAFEIDAHGESLIVLTADGHLHRLNPMTGEALEASISVMGAFAIESGHSQARPTFTLGAERAFVVDPRQTEVIEIHVDDWEIERRIEVGGAPGSAAIFSVSPDFGEPHEHDHTH